MSHVTHITTSVQHGFPLAKHDLTPTHLTQTQEQVPCVPIFSSETFMCCSVLDTSHQTRSSTTVLTKSPTSGDVVLILGVGSRGLIFSMARAGFQVIYIGDLFETDIIGVSIIGAPLHSITAKECVDRIFDTCVVVATYLESSCYTFRRQKPFCLTVTHSSRGPNHLCLFANGTRARRDSGRHVVHQHFNRVRILGVPVALEATDNCRFWQAFSTQCAGFDVSIVALCIMGGAHPKRVRLVGSWLPGILPASVRCDGLHVHAQKTKSKEDALALATELLSPFYNEIAHAIGRQLGRALNSHFPQCAPFDMQCSITQAALRQPRGAKGIPMLPEYLQMITTEVSGELAAALLAYIRKNPSGKGVPHGATLLPLLDHWSNISRAPILAPIRIHVSSFSSEGPKGGIVPGTDASLWDLCWPIQTTSINLQTSACAFTSSGGIYGHGEIFLNALVFSLERELRATATYRLHVMARY